MRSIDLLMAFSLQKQADIATAIADAKIDRMLPYSTFAPSTQEFPNALSDADYYGKGNSFASWWDPVTQQVVMPSREFSLSNLSALFAPAMVLGKVVTTQPNSSGAAEVFDHKFTFQDPSTEDECVYTTMFEKMGGVYQRVISGAFLDQFTLNGALNQHVTIGWSGFARKMATSVAALPAGVTPTSSFFMTNKATFTFGQSGQAGTDISAQVLSWQLQCMQNPNRFWLAGNAAGEEKLLTRVLTGKQRSTGSITILLEDESQKTLFENNTKCSLNILLKGNQIGTTGLYNQVTIDVPRFYIPSESFGEEQDQVTYTMPFNEQTILKEAGQDYISITVRCTEDASKILVAG